MNKSAFYMLLSRKTRNATRTKIMKYIAVSILL